MGISPELIFCGCPRKKKKTPEKRGLVYLFEDVKRQCELGWWEAVHRDILQGCPCGLWQLGSLLWVLVGSLSVENMSETVTQVVRENDEFRFVSDPIRIMFMSL